MICPNCKKENESSSKFCMFCGTRLVPEQSRGISDSFNMNSCSVEESVKSRNKASSSIIRKQTTGEKVLIKVSHCLLYLSIIIVVLLVLGKVIYQETIVYAYPTPPSEYWYEYTTKGPGEQTVIVRIYFLKITNKKDWLLDIGRSYKHCQSRKEVDSVLGEVRSNALQEYQETMNEAILFMIVLSIALFLLDRYITKTCTPTKISEKEIRREL